MAKSLAIVLSDLHFGEESSVLHYGQKFKKEPHPLVNTLTTSIKQHVVHEKIPFLIFAGDTLDFSLASVNDAVTDFRRFLEDVHEMFDNFVYIPGNHDHHLWCTLQEQICILNRIRGRREIKDFPQEQVGAIKDGKLMLEGVDQENLLGYDTFLNSLLPPLARKKNFAVTYPNLFLKFENSEKNILITHGHFFEVAWTLTSDIFKKSLNLGTINYKVLEKINSPLTEFGWYGLGQAGELSHFIGTLYKEIKNSEDQKLTLALNDLREYLDKLWTFKPAKKEGFFARIKEVFSELRADGMERGTDLALKLMLLLVKHLIISQVEEEESKPYTGGSPLRHCPNILADPEKKERIKRYLAYNLDRSYEFKPYQLIFGHTHRPINNETFETPGGNIAVFNTGGWMVDTKKPQHIIESRPMPLLISQEGDIEPIDFPWADDEGMLKNKEIPEIIDLIQKK